MDGSSQKRHEGHVPARQPEGTVPVLDALRRFSELDEAPSQFNGGPAFWLDGREIVHLHGDELEIRVTRRLALRIEDERVWQRSPGSDWLGLQAAHVELALELVRRAIDTYR